MLTFYGHFGVLQNSHFRYTVAKFLMDFNVPLSQTEIAFLLALLAIGLLLIAHIRLERKFYRLVNRGKSQTLDETIHFLTDKSKEYDVFRKELEKYLTQVETRLRQSVQGMGMVRFNPFKGTGSGGNQSFATAFINESGNGIVLSSLYSRDHVSLFAKPIRKFESEFDLTAEEKEALTKAKEELKN